jgi:hypothetical protein
VNATDPDPTDAAETVVVSYPADLSEWGRSALENRPFRAYLGKTLGTVEPGDEFAEFVGAGCCGDTLDVPLRVESVQGGTDVTEDTTVEYEVRDPCGIQGGWAVQSESGPAE